MKHSGFEIKAYTKNEMGISIFSDLKTGQDYKREGVVSLLDRVEKKYGYISEKYICYLSEILELEEKYSKRSIIHRSKNGSKCEIMAWK